ncbi:hypothetical protein OS493_003442 [Desmophyllum pertusum]|uniref:C-type lectin domain-containing protein n=1 Tax=Desmophyllum pertusum TaxID=174260 RepID=A0A9X0A5G6_9CNID|nr:hypothetical protein OS493_003442 [Desmophyllum pertusum]
MMTRFQYSRKLSWENARVVCLGLEGDLVSIEDEKEMDFVNKISSMFKGNDKWIGLNDRLKEDQFVWSDGTPFNRSRSYSNWRNKEPNNKGNEDCVELYYNIWNDDSCSGTNFYICERPKVLWIGLNDIEHEGTYRWEVDNSTVNFTNWEPNNPDNQNIWNNEDCGEVGATRKFFGLWNDRSCLDRKVTSARNQPMDVSQLINVDKRRNILWNAALINFVIKCSSNISFADCAKNQTRVNCTSPMTRCVKTAYSTKGDDKTVTYYKGCAKTHECTETAEKPFVECCSDDMCNKESGLSCFKCSSTVSHEECKAHRQEVTCKSSMADRCYYASMQQTSQDVNKEEITTQENAVSNTPTQENVGPPTYQHKKMRSPI